jgi:exosortase/archaeosortase family protein
VTIRHAQQCRQNRFGRFAALFFVAVLTSHGVLETDFAWRHMREPFCRGLARICGDVVGRVVDGVQVHHNRIDGPRMSIAIVGGCDALNAIAIFCSAVVVFPSTLRARLFCILWGATFLMVVNVLRIVALFWLGTHTPWAFDAAHLYAFQMSLVATAACLFLGWAQRAPPRVKAS